MIIKEFVGRLDGVKRTTRGGYVARCPAHQDREQSLSVDEGEDGRVLLKCFAGCTAADVVAALGLTLADLFPASRRAPNRPGRGRARCRRKQKTGVGGATSPGNRFDRLTAPSGGLRLADYAAAKGLPEAFLRELGLTQITLSGAPAVKIPYYDPSGEERAVRFRFRLQGGQGRFRWKTGTKPCPYGLERLGAARPSGILALVEGESDTQTLWLHGVPALGLPGADTWQEAWASYLEGIGRLYVVLEPDHGGVAVRQWLARSAIRDRTALVSLAPHKDPSALYLADRAGFPAAWGAALARAVPWAEDAAAQQADAAARAAPAAFRLLNDPALDRCIGRAIRATGYAGPLWTPRLVHLALTSRLLERPMNMALVGPSAAGKNAVLDAARALIPPEALYDMSAGTAHALVYEDEEYTHRTVIVAEVDSLPDEGPAASAIRSIAQDNEMIYKVVEREARSGHFVTRTIRKHGPTGVITTSTRSLRTQLGTRHLEVPVADDAEQTRKVMGAHARRVSVDPPIAPDLTAFFDLQRWLASGGARRVIVPFADALADLVPAAAVRMRRDFRQLLTAIQTRALLYQLQRARSPSGAVVATVTDYAAIRPLLAPLFDMIVAEGVTPAVRAIVEAIGPEESHVTVTDLATRLGVSKQTAAYRVGRATAGRWLVNDETRKGRPAQLRRGLPLPEVWEALPTADQVEERSNGQNRFREGGPPSPQNASGNGPGDEDDDWPDGDGFEAPMRQPGEEG